MRVGSADLVVRIERVVDGSETVVADAAPGIFQRFLDDSTIAPVDGDEDLINEGVGDGGDGRVIGPRTIIEDLFADLVDKRKALHAQSPEGREDQGRESAAGEEVLVFIGF